MIGVLLDLLPLCAIEADLINRLIALIVGEQDLALVIVPSHQDIRINQPCAVLELLDEVFEGVGSSDLSPLCYNSFVRTVYKLDYFGTVIEACFDRGIIYNSDKSGSDEICELELEFISGNVNELMVLSERIKGEFDCLPLDKSKFQRTLELAKRG